MGKREKPPSLKPVRFRRKHPEDAENDICVECGDTAAQDDSFVCRECASKTSMADIRREINHIRNRILLPK